jgi:hypothetical protein
MSQTGIFWFQNRRSDLSIRTDIDKRCGNVLTGLTYRYSHYLPLMRCVKEPEYQEKRISSALYFRII